MANGPDLTDGPALLARCQALLDAGQPAAALPLCTLGRRLAAGVAARRALRLLEASALLCLGHLDRARETLAPLLHEAADLDEAQRASAALLLAAVQLGQQDYPGASEAIDRAAALIDANAATVVRVELSRLRAELLRLQGDYPAAAALLGAALALARDAGLAVAEGQVLLAQAQLAWADGRSGEAAEAAFAAVVILERSGAAHPLARAYLDVAALLVDAAARGDPALAERFPRPPAEYLAEARRLLAAAGSLRDLERVRQCFRIAGRRATDRAADPALEEEVQSVVAAELGLGDLADGLADRLAADPPGPPVLDLHAELRGQLVELLRRTDRLVTAAHAAVVDRDQLREVLDGVRRLSGLMGSDRLPWEVVALAARIVDADRVVLALVSRRGELTERERFGPPPPDPRAWRFVAEQARREGAPVLAAGEGAAPARSDLGRAMAVPVKQGDRVHGVLYADRQPRGGVFSRRDLGLLEVVALQAAALLENQRMSWALQMSAKVRETTLEAVSDGILSVAMDGTIRQANGVAARLLGRAADAMEGQNFWDLPALADQRAAAPDLESLEGKLLRLPGGEAVASVRLIKDDAGVAAGVLVALTGLRRAQRAAQRILGARARYTEADILGDDPAFREQVRRALSAASSDASILLTGESGTGKEVLAQAVHNASPRAAGPFVGINCAAIPRDLLESELFGHEEGAFTGSRKGGQPGKFELAEGGTLLLDEIGDMPPEMQVKLLRVLQERRFQRVGGSREHAVDVRIIATTNRDLEVLAQQQRFRPDLLFRLKVIHAHLPALRERRGDIPLLVQVFLQGLSEKAGKRLRGVAPVVMEAFLDYGWPGNIRELQSVLEGEVSRAAPEAEEITAVPEDLGMARRRRRETLLSLPTMELPLADVVANAEKDRLVAALTEQRGDVLEVARMLGVSRATVYNKIRQFGIDVKRMRSGS